MKKRFRHIIYLLIIFSAFSGRAYSQFSFGLDGGLTYNGLSGDVPEDASYKRKAGFTAGAHFDLKLSKEIFLGIGARYYNTGSTVTYDVGEKETKDSFDVSLGYVSVPLTFKVLTSGQHLYFSSGFDFRYLLNAKLKYLAITSEDKDIKDNVQNYELAIFAGFGGIISFGKPNVGIELRYSHSLNNLSKDNMSSTSGLPARYRFTGFQLLMSFNFDTKK